MEAHTVRIVASHVPGHPVLVPRAEGLHHPRRQMSNDALGGHSVRASQLDGHEHGGMRSHKHKHKHKKHLSSTQLTSYRTLWGAEGGARKT